MRSTARLGRGVVVGAPTNPTTVAVPVTSPARESERGEDGLCSSSAEKLEKSNSDTMPCPLKVRTDNE